MSLRRAAFLDRDGVINVDRGYVHTRGDFEFIEGVFDAAAKLSNKGYALFVITNQSGIGRGWYTEEQFLQLDNWMREQFAQSGTAIEATYYCPHHPTDAVGRFRRQCDCRKPAPGMLLRAAREHGLDLSQSVMLGDTFADLQAAKAAGVSTRVLLGKNAIATPDEPAPLGLASARFRSLSEAASAIEANGLVTTAS
jgi:D-glycero-D-manno-heptose 1,7-bisphosphate phosphatase